MSLPPRHERGLYSIWTCDTPSGSGEGTEALPQLAMSHADTGQTRLVLLTLSSEIHIKSSRTRGRFMKRLARNLGSKLAKKAPETRLLRTWDRFILEGGDLEKAAQLASETFGVQRAQIVRSIRAPNLEDLARQVAEASRDRVRGKTFAVRVKRRGEHTWRSMDAERLIGTLLLPDSAGVDLTNPEVCVRLYVLEREVFLVEKSIEGPDGLPLGVQGRTLTLLSGGFDSAVAAWMIMRRGAQTDFLHFLMDCAQSEHSTAVAYELFDRWGHGGRSLMHVVDFQLVKEELHTKVDSRLRQVVLKQLMISVADQVAEKLGIPVLVTGECVGQVSSQTLEHLAAIDRHATRTILRPLSGLTKREIIELSRRVGTHDLSARAKEVCDLSDGPVATAAGRRELEFAFDSLSPGLSQEVLAQWRVLAVKDWGPGDPMVPVVPEAPEGIPLVQLESEDVPESGPIALAGRRAPHVASALHRAGREVWVVDEARAGTPV